MKNHLRNVFRFLSLAVALVVGLGVAVPAMAGSGTGTITAIYTQPTGIVLVNVTGTISSPPSCATTGPRWAIDPSTTAGKTMLSNIQIAFALGKSINVVGASNCSYWGDTESIYYFSVLQ